MQDVLQNIIDYTIYPAKMFFDPGERIFLPYLLMAVVMGFLVYVFKEQKTGQHKSFFAFMFPKEIYTHKSAKLDYVYFWINQIVFILTIPVAAMLGVFLSDGILNALEYLGQSPFIIEEGQKASLGVLVVYTIILGLATDFGVFYAHYIFHMKPRLWHFHKVHHSAEVLTPITVYRMHPVDNMVTVGLAGVTAAFASGTFRYLFAPDIQPLTIGSVGAIILVYYLLGYNLRHSHIWLHYPKWLSWLLISPAQHQVHHSIDVKHYDKNFGLIFSIWDRMFGTLYVPQQKEDIKFGLKPFKGQRHQHNSIGELFIAPIEDFLNHKK